MEYSKNLESRAKESQRPGLKSEGERKIAYFLDRNDIKYKYESAVIVHSSGGKPRIWYPDFFLPEFGSYIEYYGLAGNQNYNRGIKIKEKTYSKNGLHVIPVYPWMLKKNWQGYIIKELDTNNHRRYRNLSTKRYWSYQKQIPYRCNSIRTGYRRKMNRRY